MSTSTITRARPRKLLPAEVSFRLRRKTSAPLYQQVQSLISEHIAEGRLSEGDRLPSLQQLSDEMGIAYATVARGVRMLVECGALEARAGSGTCVASQRRETAHRTGILSTFSCDHVVNKTRYYRSLLFLLQETLVQHGQTVLYNHWDSEASLQEVIATLPQMDGVILFGTPPSHLEQIGALRRTLPLVCLGDTFRDSRIPAVHTTNDQDAARVAELLWGNGHQRVALLTPHPANTTYTVGQRVQGFQEARQLLGAENDVHLLGTPEEWAEQLLALKEKPSAIVWPDFMWAFGRIFDKLRGTAVEPGRNVELVIWDENLWHSTTPYNFPFWSVEQPLQQIANVAVEELSRMAQEPAYQSGQLQLGSKIVRVEPTTARQYSGKEY